MNRRQFIQTGAAISLLSGASFEALAAKKKLKNYGCQLYSVRDQMAKKPIETMRGLAGMGYTQFESYSGDPYWGMSIDEAKRFFKEIKVDLVSTHMGLKDINDESAAKAKEVGLKYLIVPYIGPQKSEDEWKKRAEDFNHAGELCKKYGLKFGYHNHNYSFERKDGVMGQEILLQNTDPKLVRFELDIFWIEAAGGNAIEHFQKYAGRYDLCHVKQMVKREPKPSQGILEGGMLNYDKILTVAKKSGVKYFLVEQEEYAGTSMDPMKANAAFMSNIKI